MIIKSNSVPNFFFENPVKTKPKFQKRNSFLFTKPKIMSYGEFLRTNKNTTRSERQNAIRRFYDTVFNG